jgi:hypothetical protein
MGWYFPTFINNIAVEAWRRHARERRGITLRDLPAREGDSLIEAPAAAEPAS